MYEHQLESAQIFCCTECRAHLSSVDQVSVLDVLQLGLVDVQVCTDRTW